MFVEGTRRWQVTEDCPWDLLLTLALRDVAGLDLAGSERTGIPILPPLTPALVPVRQNGSVAAHPAAMLLEQQWSSLFERAVDRENRPLTGLLTPPHFAALDRALELQDLVIEHYAEASAWASERHAEYADTSIERHALRAADIVEVVRQREHELRRQAGCFRLDLDVLPLAEPGAWIVGPHTVVVSASLRDDSPAFRAFFRPLIAALV